MNKKAPKLYMNRKLVDDMGNQFDIPLNEPDMFGVEIELEGRNIVTNKPAINTYWAKHQDGSLRCKTPEDQATEYVLKRPFNLADTIKALSHLFDYLNTNEGTIVHESYRTSIHVHINVLSETLRTIVNFITLSVIFDELFVSQNGLTRIGNNFCLRSRDAEGQLAMVVDSLELHGNLLSLNHQFRYSSVNLASITKFGTIEFRSLECTTDLQRVVNWIRTIQRLKEKARDFENPRDIMAEFSRRGTLGFMLSILGDYAAPYLKVPNAQQMLRDGMWLAQDLAYCVDWKVSEYEAPKPRTTRKRTSDPIGAAMNVYHAMAMNGQVVGPWGLQPQQPLYPPDEQPDADEPLLPDFDDDEG